MNNFLYPGIEFNPTTDFPAELDHEQEANLELDLMGIPADLSDKIVLELYSGAEWNSKREQINSRNAERYFSLELADRENQPGSHLRADARALPLPDKSIDTIFMTGAPLFRPISSRLLRIVGIDDQVDQKDAAPMLRECLRVLTEKSGSSISLMPLSSRWAIKQFGTILRSIDPEFDHKFRIEATTYRLPFKIDKRTGRHLTGKGSTYQYAVKIVRL